MSAFRKHMPRTTRLLVSAFFLYIFVWVKGWPRIYDDEELPAIQRPQQQGAPVGPYQVERDQLVVSVTTTAINVYSKVAPLILNTANEDHGMLLLFSDLQAQIGAWPVFDVVWRLTPDVVLHIDELKRYRAQLDFARRSIPLQDLIKADPEEERKDMLILDKYKILQTMSAAWEYRPDRSWYIFVDDETYVNRPNLIEWLGQHNPDAKHYFANPPIPAETLVPDPFAPSGTSFIVSRKVMVELFVDRKDYIKKWAKHIPEYASAYHLVTSVLQEELNVSVVPVWPGITGYDPSTAPFHPSLWCEQVMIMHHVTPKMGGDLVKLEREQPAHQPMRFADLWNRFFTPEDLNSTRNNWDNLSSEASNGRWNILFENNEGDKDRAKSGEESPEACQTSCEASTYCVQWSYSSIPQTNWNDNPETKCHLSSSIRFGTHVKPKEVPGTDGKQTLSWKSGWKKARFHNWARRQRCNQHLQ
ncbi:glycosyltransferase family 31 protein [Bipolaris maydis ATCC 48331]|uniref:N-acetylgalactosaminide beta-1,3-galactosyltransferase n=2 Tax=Cochliobolus heterostrophus TaxID=5016 RepID=M2V7A6_COCH5|nr:glycosyltransferase family 31 protein [Bipolaris maydis ATCC 48331]EMD95877.1 glycosyltransferase family 31 protein [Bipolaris maydis C5]KAJ5030590.1 glycosyltransferase [Bipolaris maydis]ENI10738.1 glycosyltransferase family 31 protein [Bipolaris maydis ATCC 48331]KAJ5065607.1 hypothetical protein J3E74DRAFT_462110 [Bipolaris maydis]KAJ6200812.1 hypothetical protein J3E72DRAFT_383322 [Bipolaris maydis]